MSERNTLLFPDGIYVSNTNNPDVSKLTINIEKLVNWFESNNVKKTEKGNVTFVCGKNSEEKKASMPYPKDTTIYYNPDYTPNNTAGNSRQQSYNSQSSKPSKSATVNKANSTSSGKLSYREQMLKLQEEQEAQERLEQEQKDYQANWRKEAGLPEAPSDDSYDDLPF